LRVLSELEAGGGVSQRLLARRLGIALGLANEVVRELVEQGLVSLRRKSGTRLEYRLTRAGTSHHARAMRAHLSSVVGDYCQARQRIQTRLASLAARAGAARPLRVVFYDDGCGAAEIGWLCLQGIELTLVGIVGEAAGRSVYQMDVQCCDRLEGMHLGGEPFDRLVVMSFAPPHRIRTRLRRCAVPRGVTVWI
jgi:DNA-binding MarR family transcriptional regulator